MAQIIIEDLKCHYERLMPCLRVEATDEGKEFNLTLLEPLHVAQSAWKEVGNSTMRTCFAKAKFIKVEIQTEEQDVKPIYLFDFPQADERLDTSGSFTLEEIAERRCCAVRSQLKAEMTI
ncbi:hypothetical protein RF11_00190 [Thelohanellus kitauei]|uniref:Uncharacterized protein n=1 Tax=Thelohanellus kitauei TaxID=669202 RepID=A0A0C2N1Z6_THEKT|nr:hypothetical protein RF11_00190 [Thelohanellus kitauei]